MESSERATVKEQLRAMAAGRGDGIDVDTPEIWVCEEVENADLFFESLPIILPEGSNLYFEGSSIIPDAEKLYEAHRAKDAVAVIRDTIFPVPTMFHVRVSEQFISEIREMLKRHALPELFDHVKGYKGETLLFSFHDAFSGWLVISERVAADSVKEFFEKLKLVPRKEETKKRDSAALQKLLELMDDPDGYRKVRIAGEPWWRRLLRRFGF